MLETLPLGLFVLDRELRVVSANREGAAPLPFDAGRVGEPGRQRLPLRPARAVADLMLDPILADLDFSGDAGVILFVNSMGATPLIELYVMYHEVATTLDKAGIRIARSLVGPYITSLDMAGCSVTLLRADDELLQLWDHPVNTPALRKGC